MPRRMQGNPIIRPKFSFQHCQRGDRVARNSAAHRLREPNPSQKGMRFRNMSMPLRGAPGRTPRVNLRLCLLAFSVLTAGCQIAPPWSRADATPAGLIAFSEQKGLWLMRSDGSARRLLIRSADSEAIEPAFSPDGRQIAFATGVHVEGPNAPPFDVVVMNLDGSGARTISPSSGGRMPSWSPDGSRIAFSSRGHLMTARPDGSDLKDLLILGDCPVWSPDSRQIAFCG